MWLCGTRLLWIVISVSKAFDITVGKVYIPFIFLFLFLTSLSPPPSHFIYTPFPAASKMMNRCYKAAWDEHFVVEDKQPRCGKIFTASDWALSPIVFHTTSSWAISLSLSPPLCQIGSSLSIISYFHDLGLRSKDLGLSFLLWLWWFEAWAMVELVRLDFLVEVVVVLRAVWWLWLWISRFVVGGGGAWLMVVDSGFDVGGSGAGFGCSWVWRVEKKRDASGNHNLLCSVSGFQSIILAKSGVKNWDIWLSFVIKQKCWIFWVTVGFWLWVMGFEFELWKLSTKLWKLSKP